MFENRKNSNVKSDRRISRADLYPVAFFLLLALGIFGWSAFGREDGQTLRISCDGQIVEEVSLAQIRQHDPAGAGRGSAAETVRYCLLLNVNGHVSCEWREKSPDPSAAVPEGSSYNLIAIDGERVWMQAADCPDQICVHHIPIKGGGESIICLPHKLVVEMVGGTDVETLDGMAKIGGMTGGAGWNNDTLRNGGSYETDG